MTDHQKHAGKFRLPMGNGSYREIYGELTLAEGDTSLYLRDDLFIPLLHIHDNCIHGTLYDFREVTLIGCNIPSQVSSCGNGVDHYEYTKIFPHYVVIGHEHYIPENNSVIRVGFGVDDIADLFYDQYAFGTLDDAGPYILDIVKAKNNKCNIVIGPEPQIAYFSGKKEIFTAETDIGVISASHHPYSNIDGSNGVKIDNSLGIKIAFQKAVNFSDAISKTAVLLQYLGLLIGRPQNLKGLWIGLESNETVQSSLSVYWSLQPKREATNESNEPHPASILIKAVQNPDEFSLVIKNWLGVHDSMRDARQRFFQSYSNQKLYTIDRLVGAANMFDILPDHAVPADVEISEELKNAKKQCREIFLGLPVSYERDSMLSALGRIGKSTLKSKIRYRGQIVLDKIGDRLPDLFTVTDEAVVCRNHYVHGSAPSFNYELSYRNNFMAGSFFTNTLEFVFAMSDLIEAGWDINVWIETAFLRIHPFGRFLENYSAQIEDLKECLK